LGLIVGLFGPSYAGSGIPASYTCTFGGTLGTGNILSDTGSTPEGAGSGTYTCCRLVNVPPSKCFSLTDVSAASNNGQRRLNIDSGTPGSGECGRATELFVWWEGGTTAAGTATQDFQTELFFSGGSRSGSGTDVLATSDNNNQNISISISGVWVPCPEHND
jgi:hypothetical protein